MSQDIETTATASGGEVPETALLGWSLEAMEALDKAKLPFLAVVPPEFEGWMKDNGVAYELWNFDKISHHSGELADRLMERGVRVAVPLYEETVEWAGAINGRIREDPRCFNRALLFRDKAMMKRKAQMSGIRVGVFEEVDSREQVGRFLKRVNQALLKDGHEANEPIHMKPISAAGSVGHRMIRSADDLLEINDDEFPCLIESHLAGQEFSCEAFVHKGKIRFLNITEYIHLGYSNFVPGSKTLEEQRPLITKAIEQLIEAFEIEYGMIHPEYFITSDGVIQFGEVAARVPGGHIFELIGRAHGFDPFVGFALCSNPDTPEEVLEDFFPAQDRPPLKYSGCLMVYPKPGIIDELAVPDGLLEEDYFVRHNLYQPVTRKVQERAGFGDHYGTVYFEGEDPERVRELLLKYEEVDFYQ